LAVRVVQSGGTPVRLIAVAETRQRLTSNPSADPVRLTNRPGDEAISFTHSTGSESGSVNEGQLIYGGDDVTYGGEYVTYGV
jgi:hypothetical protein